MKQEKLVKLLRTVGKCLELWEMFVRACAESHLDCLTTPTSQFHLKRKSRLDLWWEEQCARLGLPPDTHPVDFRHAWCCDVLGLDRALTTSAELKKKQWEHVQGTVKPA